MHAEGAARGRVAAGLVGAEAERLLPIGGVEVGVVRLQAVTVRELAVVSAPGGPLPLILRAEPGPGHASAAEPGHVGLGVLPVDAGDRQALPSHPGAAGGPPLHDWPPPP